MKKMLQCDFCSQTVTEDQYSLIDEHETQCSFNPKNRLCYSCGNRSYGLFPSDSDKCAKGCSFNHMCSIQDGDIPCPHWSVEKS